MGNPTSVPAGSEHTEVISPFLIPGQVFSKNQTAFSKHPQTVSFYLLWIHLVPPLYIYIYMT